MVFGNTIFSSKFSVCPFSISLMASQFCNTVLLHSFLFADILNNVTCNLAQMIFISDIRNSKFENTSGCSLPKLFQQHSIFALKIKNALDFL